MAKYEDLPLTNFPDTEDNWARMSDLTASLITVALQYNNLWDSGDIDGANALLNSNPTLKNTIFNADKWNKLRDAVISLERYYLNDVQTFIERVAQSTIGINDAPSEEDKITNTYSAHKLDQLFDQMKSVKTALLAAENWSDTAPYTQTVEVTGITAADEPIISLLLADNADGTSTKAQNKAWGFVDKGVTGDGTITFYCYNKKPAVDFSVGIKGV